MGVCVLLDAAGDKKEVAMPYIRKVSKRVAMNPIARAAARKQLASAVTDQKIRLYMMEKGEKCADVMEAIGKTLAVVGYASELDPKLSGEDPRVRVLRGGLSACQQMLLADSWDPVQARSIDMALDAAMDLNMKVGGEFVNEAIHALGAHQ